MFWVSIMTQGCTELRHFESTIMGNRYIRDIFNSDFSLWRGTTGENFLFMNDNAHPHRSRAVDDYLKTKGIHCMDWPAISPGMNPIKYAWDISMLGAVRDRLSPPRILQGLVVATREEWETLPKK